MTFKPPMHLAPLFVTVVIRTTFSVPADSIATYPADSSMVISEQPGAASPLPNQAVPPGEEPDGYYGGQGPLYRGMSRGIDRTATETRTARKLLITPETAPPDSISNAGVVVDTTGRQPATQGNDSVPAPILPGRSRLGRKGKIIAAIGTTAAIGGFITYFLIRRNAENGGDAGRGIPDPPDPPVY